MLPAVGILQRCAEAPTEICPAEGGFPRTSDIKYNFVRQEAGFHGQTAQPRATKIRKSGCRIVQNLSEDNGRAEKDMRGISGD